MSNQVTSDRIPNYNVKQTLRALGASTYVLSRPEVGKIASLLHTGEKIEAFIYGVHSAGWGMMIASDRKLIFVDKIFFDLKVDELPYSMISAVDHNFGRYFGKVTVHTRSKDYSFRRIRCKCAERFVDFIEEKMLQTQEATSGSLRELQLPDPKFNYSPTFHVPTTTG